MDDHAGYINVYVLKSSTAHKNYASFGLINLVFTQILWKNYKNIKFFRLFTTDIVTLLAPDFL